MVLANAREKGFFMCGRPGHAAKDYKFNQTKGKGQGKEKAKSTSTDKNTPAKFEGVARKVTVGQTEAKDKKVHSVGETPSTSTAAALEETEVIDEARMSSRLF